MIRRKIGIVPERNRNLQVVEESFEYFQSKKIWDLESLQEGLLKSIHSSSNNWGLGIKFLKK